MTNPIIENKPTFTLIGVGRDFQKENCYMEIPQFWDEYMSRELRPIKGRFGVCIDSGELIHYLVADVYDPGITILPEWETITLERGEWAIFQSDGQLPESLQAVNTYVWSEWVPGNGEYELRADYSLEYYPHDVRDSEYTHSEIWLPVKEIA